jgi:hypothetical protein
MNKHQLTADELVTLKAKFPEGIPAWMKDRGMTPKEIEGAMQLRRKAFPATEKK